MRNDTENSLANLLPFLLFLDCIALLVRQSWEILLARGYLRECLLRVGEGLEAVRFGGDGGGACYGGEGHRCEYLRVSWAGTGRFVGDD